MEPERTIAWPQKRRDMHNHHLDTSVWDSVELRSGDIVLASWPKSGSTWTQQLIGQILRGGSAELDITKESLWVDLRVPPTPVKLDILANMPGRRFVKTHAPVDAIVYSPEAKYVYVGRDGRDVVWSLFNHHATANEQWYATLNDTPGLVGEPMPRPPASVSEYFNTWLERDGYPLWPFWELVASWWAIRELPNIHFTHHARLKQDFAGEARALAAFLGESVAEDAWAAITEHCSFEYMKRNAGRVAPLGGVFWEGGPSTVIHKGTNGRWQDTLSPAQLERYEATARERLGDACAHWLATGELP